MQKGPGLIAASTGPVLKAPGAKKRKKNHGLDYNQGELGWVTSPEKKPGKRAGGPKKAETKGGREKGGVKGGGGGGRWGEKSC